MRKLKPVCPAVFGGELVHVAVGEAAGDAFLVALRGRGTVEVGDMLVANVAEPV